MAVLAIAGICTPAVAGVWLIFTHTPDDWNDPNSGPASFIVFKVFESATVAGDSALFWNCTPVQCFIIPNTPPAKNPGTIDSFYVSFDGIEQDTLFVSGVVCDTSGTQGKELRSGVSNVAVVIKPDIVAPAAIGDLEILRYE
jgi:hypothetical protein